MKIHECQQGTMEWLEMRAGIPTASEFDNIITPLWKPREGKGVESYMFRKLAEKVMGVPILDAGGTFAMDQGSLLESEAIPFIEFMNDLQIQRVGFITTDDGRIGCSPDGLIGDEGGIEIKCPRPDTHLRYLMAGVVPNDYLAQVHGSMFVTGRPWWMFCSYSKQFPPLIIHVKRDERIQSAIGAALESFLVDFDARFAEVLELKKSDTRPPEPVATWGEDSTVGDVRF